MAAGADVVSIDCTDCVRGDGLTPTEFLKAVREEYPNIIIMADCATFEEGVAAHAAGADLVGTTMNGYTPQTADQKGDPNFALAEQLAAEGKVLIIAPDDTCGVKTLTRDQEALKKLYSKGIRDAQAIEAFIK